MEMVIDGISSGRMFCRDGCAEGSRLPEWPLEFVRRRHGFTGRTCIAEALSGESICCVRNIEAGYNRGIRFRMEEK